ncbi:hypothetical protein SY88_08180 [Clostridiales bacterium PH28_bin88]|nr:hypothetical protein SY88_08180 [Clostridiales bacterium PH28_bin88]
MRLKDYYAPTLKNTPSAAGTASEQLAVRAGLVRKEAAGLYHLLPLGRRVLRRLEDISLKDMEREGYQEVMVTGGREAVGKLAAEIKSYKQLPLKLFTLDVDYRGNAKPSFSLSGSRGPLTLGMYHVGVKDPVSPIKHLKTFCHQIARKCAVKARWVGAPSGLDGARQALVLLAASEAGETGFVTCPGCGYTATVEAAEFSRPIPPAEPALPMEKVLTPGVRTMARLEEFLGVKESKTIKTLIYHVAYQDRVEPVGAMVAGERAVNEQKLAGVLGADSLRLATKEEAREVTGCSTGFSGPVGLKVRLIADPEITGMVNGVAGANEDDYHLINVNPGRDFGWHQMADIGMVREGDACPHCREPLQFARGTGLGRIALYGETWSKRSGAAITGEDGKEAPMELVFAELDLSRLGAVIIEQNHDGNGICWPAATAPFQVVLVQVKSNDAHHSAAAEALYRQLADRGYTVMLDDRDERAGSKFKDADLIGYPVRVVIGQALERGEVEVTARATGETRTVKLEEIVAAIEKIIPED